MTKLRNIGYLRFGSKIRQGFADGITSLTPPISLSPLWISWAENEGAEGRGRVLYLRREPAAPCRVAGPLPPTGGAVGGLPPGRGAAGSRQGPLHKKIYFYLHIGPYRPPAGR